MPHTVIGSEQRRRSGRSLSWRLSWRLSSRTCRVRYTISTLRYSYICTPPPPVAARGTLSYVTRGLYAACAYLGTRWCVHAVTLAYMPRITFWVRFRWSMSWTHLLRKASCPFRVARCTNYNPRSRSTTRHEPVTRPPRALATVTSRPTHTTWKSGTAQPVFSWELRAAWLPFVPLLWSRSA